MNAIFLRLFEQGGVVVIPIFLLSITAWFIALDKLIHYRRLQGKWKRAHAHLSAEPSERGAAVSGYEYFDRFVEFVERPSVTPIQVERSFDELMVKISPGLNRGLSTVGAIIVITPLLGLLGTIAGMNELFGVIGEYGFGNPSILANGISMALQATLAGMSVAVAALFFLDFLNNSKTKLIDTIRKDRDFMISRALNVTAQDPAKKGKEMRRGYHNLHEEHVNTEINLAPFVDTIMILLIFFVVTANLYVETGIDVSKPKAQSAVSAGNKALMIGITREGSIHIYGRQVTPERLQAIVSQEVSKSPETTVVIIADQGAEVGKAVQVMDICAVAGASKVSIAADQGNQG